MSDMRKAVSDDSSGAATEATSEAKSGTVTGFAALIRRLRDAPEGSRELDWAIAYALGMGTDIEREVYEAHGVSWCTEDPKIRMTPLQKRHGCHYSYSRPKRGGGRVRTPETFKSIVTGPQPLRDAPHYTTSIDAARKLIDRDKFPILIIQDMGPVLGVDARVAVFDTDTSTGETKPVMFDGHGSTIPLAITIAAFGSKAGQLPPAGA